jgi:N-acetylmuramoyl-L-alanine amidase
MHRRWRRAAAVLFLLPGIAASNSGIIQVTGIHYWSHPDSTRIILDTTGPFSVRSQRAFNPDRIYFDLHARPSIDGHRFATRVVDDTLIERIRIAETTPGTTRIVFDLKVAATFTMSRLDKPDRLLIEFRPTLPDSLVIPHVSRAGAKLDARADAPVEPSPWPSPLPYVAPRAPAFVYPPGYGQIPRFRTPVLTGNPPVLTPSQPAPPELPDPSLQIALARPPQRTPSATFPLAAYARVTPAPAAAPYDATPHASANASRSLTRALGLKVNRIVIDAGHGGHDYGTIGPNGVLEKDVVLDVALRLARLVQAKMGAEVVLTRSDDTFIPLRQRTAIANEHKADLFLSIHANSSPSSGVAGTETFFLNFTNSPGALDVAARENAGSDKNIGELKDLIQSITLNDKIAESETFAQQIQNSIYAQAAKSNSVAKNRGVKRAPFVVLIGASMPSVLAEIGFLSNSRDEANLAKPEYRQKLAESLLKGLTQYSQSLSHFDVVAGKGD